MKAYTEYGYDRYIHQLLLPDNRVYCKCHQGNYIVLPPRVDVLSAVANPFYNHMYRIGNYAYCAMDYCGLEVVDVITPSLMTEVSWLDPSNPLQPQIMGDWGAANDSLGTWGGRCFW